MSEAPAIESELRSMGAEVEPDRDGLAFSLRGTRGLFTARRPDDAVEGWSLHCRVPLHMPAPVFELDVRPRTPDDRRLVEDGLAVHVGFDDTAFDREFVVDAAPSDLVRAVLDEPVRAALGDLAPCRLRREGDVLHLATGPRRGDAWVETIVSVCVGLAERLVRVRDALEANERAGRAGPSVPTYRETPLLTRTEEDDRRARDELARLHDARSVRRQIKGASFGVGLVVVAVAVGLAILAHC